MGLDFEAEMDELNLAFAKGALFSKSADIALRVYNNINDLRQHDDEANRIHARGDGDAARSTALYQWMRKLGKEKMNSANPAEVFIAMSRYTYRHMDEDEYTFYLKQVGDNEFKFYDVN
jgi:hypothetical protein